MNYPADRSTTHRFSVAPTLRDRVHRDAEVELMQAMEEYKQSSGRMFPTWSEVLEVVQALGYQKAAG